jgi:hypothetical protein
MYRKLRDVFCAELEAVSLNDRKLAEEKSATIPQCRTPATELTGNAESAKI